MSFLKRLITVSIVGTFVCSSAFANESVKVNGQVRVRSEFNSKQFTNKGAGDAVEKDGSFSHLLRTRFGITATPSEKVTIKVEAQDGRVFGSEPEAVPGVSHTATLGNSKGIDLHQAYVDLLLGDVSIKLGRQKTKLGSQRFLSSLEWHNVARVFDGVTVKAGGLTALSYVVQDAAGADNSKILSGLFWSKKKVLDLLSYDAYAFYEKDQEEITDIVWVGERIALEHPMIIAEEEFIFQTGEAGDNSVSGYYLATRAGAKLGKHSVTIGYDVMTGQEDGEGKYLNKYTFAHAYFGWMDRFIVNPAKGVQDIRLDAKLGVHKKATIKIGAHYLLEHSDGSAKGETGGDTNAYGTELNSEVHLKLFPKSKIVVGASYFIADDKQVDAANSSYLYIMPIFNF